jgi:hypothetical protein
MASLAPDSAQFLPHQLSYNCSTFFFFPGMVHAQLSQQVIMKNKTKHNNSAIFVLSKVVKVTFVFSPTLPKCRTGIALYFGVVIIVAIPLGVFLKGPLATLILKHWK